MSAGLRRCPFCGGPAAIVEDAGSFGAYQLGMVRCEECPARIVGSLDDTADMAQRWNTRVID